MAKKRKSEHAKNVVKRSMAALGASHNMKTNPKIIRSVLEEMEIDDFRTTFSPMRKFLGEIKSKPRSLRPMFKNIEKGLVTKHPAIIEFLELALKNKWLKRSEDVQRSVHITFVLEAMTAAMCSNHKFYTEALYHYRAKERALGLDKGRILKTTLAVWRMFHNWFGLAKMMALDPLMIFFRIKGGVGRSVIPKDELKKLYRNGEINYFEYNLLYRLCKTCPGPSNKLVRINIYEAGTTEYKHGFKDNALCAYALAKDLKFNPPHGEFKLKRVIPENNKDPFYRLISGRRNLFLDIETTQGWASLYTTWNMAFILGNLGNLDLLFPKLVMPSIINAEKSNFLPVRLISLWLTINHSLFRYSKNIKVTGPRNKIRMARAWSRINKKYALDFAEQETNIDSDKLIKCSSTFYANPIYRILELVKAFLMKVCIQ